MATTEAPLVWDFYREVGSDTGVQLGGVVHYYDEASQTLFLNGGLKTRTADVEDGHWADSELSSPSIFINEDPYTVLGLDHPSNGILYGAATDGSTLTFLRYIYGMDLSDIIASGAWTEQTDNKIKQLTVDLRNLGEDIFCAPNSLFNPGARLSLSFTAGDSEPYPVGVAYLDDVDYDAYGATVPLSGRNGVGFLLAGQTFDDTTSLTGTAAEVLAAIFALAGVSKYIIGPADHNKTHLFAPDQTLLAGVEQVCGYYSPWRMEELADGTVLVGSPWWIAGYVSNSTYQFHAGTDVFSRRTSKNADAAYTHVYVTGKDADGADLTPVMLPVPCWDYWALGAHKTRHAAAPDGLTQQGLADWAAGLADSLQYVGVGEQFASPLRPWLLVGDVADIYDDGDAEAVSLGLVTELRHTFGDGGFSTEFSVDSGGKVATASGATTTRNAALRGYNRKQRMTDFIGVQMDRR